jgi:general secretion pathway protein G
MKANKGFTLLEVAVVLAIIAILAAVLTPIVTSYIDQARVTRAQNDVKKIAQSILLYKRDVGNFPGYATQTEARAGFGSFSTSLASCLVTGPNSSVTLTGWTCAYTHFLESHLNANSQGFSTVGALAAGGQTGYRGPYLDGLNGLDPWGTPYAVNSGNFNPNLGYHVFAISAGPDETFDTTQNQGKGSPFTIADDDIASLIQ